MKAIRLTSHAAAMDLMVEFPGNGVVPWQRFGPRSQFFMGASSEEGAETFVSHRQVLQHLEHVKQHGNRYRVQDNRLERTHHLETATLIKLEWVHTERATWFRDSMKGADWWRDITWGSLTTRGDSRGYPPWVHFFGWDPKSWREWVIGPRNG